MAIKAVLRAHQLQGFPGLKKLKVASRFPVWDQRIRAAIVWIGYADPIGTQDLIWADDPLLEGHRRLLWILRGRFKGDPFLTCELSSKLDSEGLEYLRQITGHQNGEAFNERKVGKYFTHHLKNRPYDGLRLVKTGKSQGGKVEWRIESKKSDADFGIEEEAL